jgi:hypothetical protein
VGAAASLISLISLTFPNSFLEVIWRLNPTGREGLARIGGWSVALMSAVFVACSLAAIGLWLRFRWGYRLAIAMLSINLLASIIKAGTDARAIVGIPIALVVLIYLLRNKTRDYFV